jgi:glycosyltransferase involved in cell wall biosynthesis
MLAAKWHGVPLIQSTDAHTARSYRLRSPVLLAMKRPIVRRIFLLADVVLGMSSGSVGYLRSLDLGEDRVRRAAFVVENDWWLERSAAADRSAVRAVWKVPANAPVALFCAKLQPWKRPMDALLAFARAAVPGSHLVFAGDGPLRPALEARAKGLGVADRVRFLGFVNQSALPGAYAASDVLLLPSAHEPFGLVVNEAMLCGLPAIVSDSVGAKFDLIREGESGFVFPVGDVDALAAILRDLLPDRPRLKRVGEAARRRMETWSPREYVEDLVAAVEAARRNAGAGSSIRRETRRTVEKAL